MKDYLQKNEMARLLHYYRLLAQLAEARNMISFIEECRRSRLEMILGIAIDGHACSSVLDLLSDQGRDIVEYLTDAMIGLRHRVEADIDEMRTLWPVLQVMTLNNFDRHNWAENVSGDDPGPNLSFDPL